MRRADAFLPIGFIALLLTGTGASADVKFDSRTVVAQIKTTKPDFSDATLTTTSTTAVGTGSAGTRSVSLLTAPNIISLQPASSGAVTVDSLGFGAPVDNGGVYLAPITGSVSATGAGSFSFTDMFPGESDPFATAYLYTYQNLSFFGGYLQPLNLSAVELYFPIGGGGLVDDGNPFSIAVTIPGDYSTPSPLLSAPGQHFLANLNPDFTIDTDFTYDPVANLTTFVTSDAHYASGTSAGLDLFFFGPAAAGPVPEPATWLVMVAGIGMTGAVMRRRAAGMGIGAPA